MAERTPAGGEMSRISYLMHCKPQSAAASLHTTSNKQVAELLLSTHLHSSSDGQAWFTIAAVCYGLWSMRASERKSNKKTSTTALSARVQMRAQASKAHCYA